MASTKKNIVANYVGRSWASLLNFALTPIYISVLGIESYGLITFNLTLISISAIMDLGLGATITRELALLSSRKGTESEQREIVKTLGTVYWGLAILIALIIFFSADFISQNWINNQFFDPEMIISTVKLMSLTVALQFPTSLYQGALMGLQRQVIVNKILVILGTFRSLGAVLVILTISSTIESFFIWQVISSVVSCIVFNIFIWRNLPKSSIPTLFNIRTLKKIWKFAAAMSLNSIISILLTQLDKIILIRILTLTEFGYYSVALTSASFIWLILNPFNAAVFPRLVQLYELKNNRKLKFEFHHYSQILSVLLLPLSALLIIYSHEILMIWLNDPIIADNSYIIMGLILFGTMLNGLPSVPGNCSIGFGWPMLVTYVNLSQLIVIIPLLLWLVSLYNGIGAAITWVVLNSTYITVLTFIFFKYYLNSEKIKWYLYDIIIPAFSAFLVVLISRFIFPAFDSRFNMFMWIAFTGIITFLITSLTLPHVRKIIKKQIFIIKIKILN